MELSFGVHIISIERTCWIRPSEWTTLRANKRPEAGELRRENLTGSIHTWQLLVIWSGPGQNILVLLLCIFIKMIFPFQHLHMPVHGSENNIHLLSNTYGMHSMTSFTVTCAKSNLSYRPPKHSFTVPVGLRE